MKGRLSMSSPILSFLQVIILLGCQWQTANRDLSELYYHTISHIQGNLQTTNFLNMERKEAIYKEVTYRSLMTPTMGTKTWIES